MNNSCVLPEHTRKLAKNTINLLSKDERKEYGITDDNISWAEEALDSIISIAVNSEHDTARQEDMLNDPNGLHKILDSQYMTALVPSSSLETAVTEYEWLLKATKGLRMGVVTDEKSMEVLPQLEARYSNLLSVHKQYEKKSELHGGERYERTEPAKMTFVIKKPVASQSAKTLQERSVDAVQQLAAIPTQWLGHEYRKGISYNAETTIVGPNDPNPEESWVRTGRTLYSWGGRQVLAEPSSKFTAEYKGPVLAGPLGTAVDTVGRKVFDGSLLDDKGNISDAALEHLRESDRLVRDFFTLQGLRNLVGDFLELQKDMEEAWGTGLVYISKPFKMFGEVIEDGKKVWKVGSPDLVVVDANGRIHVVDFKSRYMFDSEYGYDYINTETLNSYSKQVTTYVRLLQSQGLDVDENAYVIRIDTWYDTEDLGKHNKPGRGHAVYNVETNAKGFAVGVTMYDEDGNPTKVTPAEYAAEHEESYDKKGQLYVLGGHSNTKYMQPRLHLHRDGKENPIDALLRSDDEDAILKFLHTMGYVRQYDLLSDKEKEELSWLFGKRVEMRAPTHGVVKLSSDDIASNPELISESEIQFLADRIMVEVSHYVTLLQDGEDLSSWDNSQGVLDNPGSRFKLSAPVNGVSPLKGRSRYDIIKLVGLEPLMIEAFNRIFHNFLDDMMDEWIANGTTFEQAMEEDEEWLLDWYDVRTKEQFDEAVKIYKKSKWILEHRDQFFRAGYAKLIALEKCVIPVKVSSSRQNGSTMPDIAGVQLSPDDISAKEDAGSDVSMEEMNDDYIEGLSGYESWILNQLSFSPKAAMSEEVRRLFEYLWQRDADGEYTKDTFGWFKAILMDPTEAIQTTYNLTRNCETMDEIMGVLYEMANTPSTAWAEDIVKRLENDKNLKAKFFQYFRKDTSVYSICEWTVGNDGKPVIRSRIINETPVRKSMLDMIGKEYESGNVGSYVIDGRRYSLLQRDDQKSKRPNRGPRTFVVKVSTLDRKKGIKTIVSMLDVLEYDCDVWGYRLNNMFKEAQKYAKTHREDGQTLKEVTMTRMGELIKMKGSEMSDGLNPYGGNDKTLCEAITDLLHLCGVMVPQGAVESAVTSNMNGFATSTARKLLYGMGGAVDGRRPGTGHTGSDRNSLWRTLGEQNGYDRGVPMGLRGLGAFRSYADTKKGLVTILADYVQQHVESSCYQDGKTYYTFVNPSRLGHTIRNLKDAMDNPKKFKAYIEREYGRYEGWFREMDYIYKGSSWRGEYIARKSRYLCDWLEKLVNGSEHWGGETYRKALKHKVEVSFLGNSYKDLGELGFLRSLLHNYFTVTTSEINEFGNRIDFDYSPEFRGMAVRWFGLPTMSNKPTNEFIRMATYRTKDRNDLLAGTKDPYVQEEGSDDLGVVFDEVIMPTFRQECNRIADVLYHYTHNSTAIDYMDLTDGKLKKAGWTTEEIKAFKERINNRQVTLEDMRRLSMMNGKLATGAKFHFLWYLNKEVLNSNKEDNKALAQGIVDRINRLMNPEKTDWSKTSEEEVYAQEAETNDLFRKVVYYDTQNKEKGILYSVIEREVENMVRIGICDTEKVYVDGKAKEACKYIMEFGFSENYKNKKNVEVQKEVIRERLWDFAVQDMAANINIIQLTGGDLAYFGNSNNYQKRIAMEHSPGLHCMHDEEFDDGFLRSVHVSDEHVRGEIKENIRATLEEYLDNHSGGMSETARKDYKRMISIICGELTKALATDGQSFSCFTSVRKKLQMQGEWDESREKAYQEVMKGNFNIDYLGVLIQPTKPFVASDLAKWSGSPSMPLRRVPIQEKNSEYLIVLAGALAIGSGKKSKLAALSMFMEKTAKEKPKAGIDTVHFESVNKVGKGGILDISEFDRQYDEKVHGDYNEALAQWLYDKVQPSTATSELAEEQAMLEKMVDDGKMERQELYYNNRYVDTIPVDDYIIQQNVPEHFLEHEQLFGSQIRILGISDISSGTIFQVRNPETGKMENIGAEDLVREYKEIQAFLIHDSYETLMAELGLHEIPLKEGSYIVTTRDDEENVVSEDAISSVMELDTKNPIRINFLERLENLLQQELAKDSKYGTDVVRACTLLHDSDGTPTDFQVPLFDPIQSTRIQQLLNSIVKKRINKQKVTGGSLVQASCYSEDLHIVFKDRKGNILKTFKEYGRSEEEYREYLKENHASIAYFECYAPIPNAELERLMLKDDGSVMSMEELKEIIPQDVLDSITQMIGYRIPTEDKYSMIPLKIVGFLPKAAGQAIMMPQEITFLTGSDFDIDKMYVILKALNIQYKKASMSSMHEIYNAYIAAGGKSSFQMLSKIIRQVIQNGNDIIDGNTRSWTFGIEREYENMEEVRNFMRWYRKWLISTTFEEYFDTNTVNITKWRGAKNNRIFDILWSVLTNEDTASKMLNPGNFDALKRQGRIIRIRKMKLVNPNTGKSWTREELADKSVGELDDILAVEDMYNTTMTSSKLYYQHQNMQGSQMTGLIANNVTSHAFCSFQKIALDLQKDQHDNTLMLDGRTIGSSRTSLMLLDRQMGFNGQLISKNIATYLAAVLDTAKDAVANDFNLNTFTGSTAMAMTRMGFDTEFINMFLAQPVLIELAELYFKNNVDNTYYGSNALKEMAAELGIDDLSDTTMLKKDMINKDNLWKHMNDSSNSEFQQQVLIAFNILYQIARDMQELTFCTKFNSATNSGGPTIADTMALQDRVEKFKENVPNSVFYVPNKGNSNYTNPSEVIDNDLILNAFYKYSVGKDGAAAALFQSMFPHYFPGFQNILSLFKNMYMKPKQRMTSKLYNMILNDYIYFLLTYSHRPTNDNEIDLAPVLPSSERELRYLIGKRVGGRQEEGLTNRFKSILRLKRNHPEMAYNVILDQGLGNNCLRVRDADLFLGIDTLVLNSSGLDYAAQQEIRNAWSDIIQVTPGFGLGRGLTEQECSELRQFGIDLFFYTLMRNGFSFSPKTMMHLASVAVRYNAKYGEGYDSYMKGIRTFRERDLLVMGGQADKGMMIRFLNQLVRNHADNSQIVPIIRGMADTMSIESKSGNLVFEASGEDKYKLDRLMLNPKTPRPFISIYMKDARGKSVKTLYQCDIAWSIVTDSNVSLVYRKVNELGLRRNFLEYNANDDMKSSYLRDVMLADTEDGSYSDRTVLEGSDRGEREQDLTHSSTLWEDDPRRNLNRMANKVDSGKPNSYKSAVAEAARQESSTSSQTKDVEERIRALKAKLAEILERRKAEQDKC